eukprot:208292-Amorphochlora_amoeboformis.AAC.1
MPRNPTTSTIAMGIRMLERSRNSQDISLNLTVQKAGRVGGRERGGRETHKSGGRSHVTATCHTDLSLKCHSEMSRVTFPGHSGKSQLAGLDSEMVLSRPLPASSRLVFVVQPSPVLKDLFISMK